VTNYQTTEQQQTRWQNRNADSGHIWTGIFLLIVGGAALAKSLLLPIPAWIFGWQTFMITLGIFIGIRGNFHGAVWLILILIGCAFLLDGMYPVIELRRHFWPLVIVCLGVFFILRPERAKRNQQLKMHSGPDDFTGLSEHVADVTTIFGTTKKKITSKQFAGGDITSLFGSTEIDLSDAEINGQVVLDVTTICGGVELIIPAHWIVKSDVISIFGSVKDRREQASLPYSDDEKIIMLDGTCMFGGIEIKSFSNK
jgi:predicted membrane protein